MSVKRCYLCEEDARVSRRYGRAGLEEGELGPIRRQPTCRCHLATVRCKGSYAHRRWDAFSGDWITCGGR